MVSRISENFARHGFGIWAVEAFGVAEFIGAIGLSVPRYETHFTPLEPKKKKRWFRFMSFESGNIYKTDM